MSSLKYDWYARLPAPLLGRPLIQSNMPWMNAGSSLPALFGDSAPPLASAHSGKLTCLPCAMAKSRWKVRLGMSVAKAAAGSTHVRVDEFHGLARLLS